jgi:hypothetical protein
MQAFIRILGAAAALLVLLAAFLVLRNRERSYDRSYDARVTEPTYRAESPVVLFDEGHFNSHTASEAYKPLADLLRSDGYTLRILKGQVTEAELEGVSILLVALAQGANETNDHPAYSDAEAAIIEAWVRRGGSLFLISDHWPYGSAVSSLARRFDVIMGEGLVEDAEHHDPERGASHLVFSEDNGLLRDHPIVRGRNAPEQVRRVLTFTGQSLQSSAAGAYTPFLALSDAATEYPPGPARAERDGSDVRVHMEYGDPVSAAGKAQGLALELEAGRVVVLGEAGMFRAQRERNGVRVGMNVSGYDNRQLAINIMHWLSRAL